MKKIEIFCDREYKKLQDDVNKFLDTIDDKNILEIIPTQAATDNTVWFTVTVFYYVER